jgi:hypothetical protein
MRFTNGLTVDQRLGRANLFTATVHVAADGRVLDEQLGQ